MAISLAPIFSCLGRLKRWRDDNLKNCEMIYKVFSICLGVNGIIQFYKVTNYSTHLEFMDMNALESIRSLLAMQMWWEVTMILISSFIGCWLASNSGRSCHPCFISVHGIILFFLAPSIMMEGSLLL